MRRSRAPSNWPGPFFAARPWAGCTTNMFGFDLRQAQDALDRAGQLRPVLTELIGMSARKIAAVLNERKVATPTGGVWHAATVIRVQKRLMLI